MVGINASTNEIIGYKTKHFRPFQDKEKTAPQRLEPCTPFFDMGAPFKTQVENGISKLFDFWSQTIDVSDQAIFILNYFGLHYEEGNKTNVSDPLTASQRRSGRFLSFKMAVHQ